MLVPSAATPPAMPAAVTPAATLATSTAPQLKWMTQEDWQVVLTRRQAIAELSDDQVIAEPTPIAEPKPWRLFTDERAAAAGLEGDWTAKAVREAELRQEDPDYAQRAKESDARRKRKRRIDEGKEDRDAMRELACSRDVDGTRLELEATPAGLRETAIDGTPRSAKAAGAKLRQLTQQFYSRLVDPRFYDVTHEELESLSVEAILWDNRDGHVYGSRPLMRFKGKRKPTVYLKDSSFPCPLRVVNGVKPSPTSSCRTLGWRSGSGSPP